MSIAAAAACNNSSDVRLRPAIYTSRARTITYITTLVIASRTKISCVVVRAVLVQMAGQRRPADKLLHMAAVLSSLISRRTPLVLVLFFHL